MSADPQVAPPNPPGSGSALRICSAVNMRRGSRSSAADAAGGAASVTPSASMRTWAFATSGHPHGQLCHLRERVSRPHRPRHHDHAASDDGCYAPHCLRQQQLLGADDRHRLTRHPTVDRGHEDLGEVVDRDGPDGSELKHQDPLLIVTSEPAGIPGEACWLEALHACARLSTWIFAVVMAVERPFNRARCATQEKPCSSASSPMRRPVRRYASETATMATSKNSAPSRRSSTITTAARSLLAKPRRYPRSGLPGSYLAVYEPSRRVLRNVVEGDPISAEDNSGNSQPGRGRVWRLAANGDWPSPRRPQGVGGPRAALGQLP